MDNTSVKNICESIKDLLDRKPVDEWEERHHKVAKMIGYERREAIECNNQQRPA